MKPHPHEAFFMRLSGITQYNAMRVMRPCLGLLYIGIYSAVEVTGNRVAGSVNNVAAPQSPPSEHICQNYLYRPQQISGAVGPRFLSPR